jgi:hypothetical protein
MLFANYFKRESEYDDGLPGKRLTEEIFIKLECMDDVGLHHLALSRSIPSLLGVCSAITDFVIFRVDILVWVRYTIKVKTA